MTFRGHVQNGLIVLDEPTSIPEGTAVRVEILDTQPRKTLAERLGDVIGAAKGLPDDMAAQHDHYLHGTPKK